MEGRAKGHQGESDIETEQLRKNPEYYDLKKAGTKVLNTILPGYLNTLHF